MRKITEDELLDFIETHPIIFMLIIAFDTGLFFLALKLLVLLYELFPIATTFMVIVVLLWIAFNFYLKIRTKKMIDITHARTYGWEAAIRGMRNPMNSWDKSDSSVNNIGENDITLMKKLAKAGTDHRKYLRMITVTCDILAPLYWWKEFDTYKVGTVANSCSTMHKIHDKEFEELDFSFENLSSELDTLDLGQTIIKTLNQLRDAYILTKDKRYWYQMIQLLPSSYNQKRTVMINYEVLANIYKARKNHKLDEWKDFCYLVEALPYSELFTQLDNNHD